MDCLNICSSCWWAVPGFYVEGRKAAISFCHIRWGSWGFFSSQVALHWLFFPIPCIGVFFMVPRVNYRAEYWTLSSLLLLVLGAVLHVVDAYFMVDVLSLVCNSPTFSFSDVTACVMFMIHAKYLLISAWRHCITMPLALIPVGDLSSAVASHFPLACLSFWSVQVHSQLTASVQFERAGKLMRFLASLGTIQDFHTYCGMFGLI